MKSSINRRTIGWAFIIAIFAGLAIGDLVTTIQNARAEVPTPARSAAVWSHGTATWYGPGYYYHHFACTGGTYYPGTRGVAVNASYAPCGARYTIRRAGHLIRVRVIDRCPGCSGPGGSHPFDLTARSAMDLCGCSRPYTMTVAYRRGW